MAYLTCVGDSAGALRVVATTRVPTPWDGAPVCAAARARLMMPTWSSRVCGGDRHVGAARDGTSLALAVAPAAGVGALAARGVSGGALVVSGGDDAALATVVPAVVGTRQVIHLRLRAGARAGVHARRARRAAAAATASCCLARRGPRRGVIGSRTATTSATSVISTVDVVGDVRGCCSTDDGALVYGDDGAATVVLWSRSRELCPRE